jgi:hypothetical protein
MGHRKVMRVPLDFDAPLNEVWHGYLMPDDVRLPPCTACDQTGYSPTARWLHDTFYDHNVRSDIGGWRDKLVQADIDALVEAGRLRALVDRAPTEDNPRTHEWVKVPRTAAEVNAANGPGAAMLGGLGHDGINCHVLVDSRCERLGAPSRCDVCEGEGEVGTDEQKLAAEAWTEVEPPEGPGWQLWTTTTEGSPITPVFATASELAVYCTEHCTPFADIRWTTEQWLTSFGAGSTEVDTLLVMRGPERGQPVSDRMAYPGFHLLVSPTHAWPASAGAEDDFAWIAYGEPDDDGMCDVRRGFESTRAAAADAARTAFVPTAPGGRRV